MAHLPHEVSGQLRMFAFLLANGTVNVKLLDGIDYDRIFEEPSWLEQVFAIFGNVLDVDEHGHVTNSGWPEYRAAQYIRTLFDFDYVVDPPFEPWETELYL